MTFFEFTAPVVLGLSVAGLRPIAIKRKYEDYEDVWYPEDMERTCDLAIVILLVCLTLTGIDALPKFASLFYGPDVTRFAEAPSVQLYRKIMKASPRSERNLKHIVGLRLDKGKNLTSEDYLCGIEVYTHLTYKPPLIALIQKINKLHRHEDWARNAATQSLLALATSVSSSDLEIRRSICSVIRDGVTEAQSGIISQLYYDMPELEDHVLRLDDTLQSKGIPRAGGTPQQAQARGKLIEKVCARALHEPPVGHQPDVAGTLNDWL